jgi:chorismate mutase
MPTFDPAGVAKPTSAFSAIHILSLRDKALCVPASIQICKRFGIFTQNVYPKSVDDL